jgi:hypothetical protein
MRLALIALFAVLASGCGGLPFVDEDDDRVPLVCGPEHRRLPCSAGVETGAEHPFNLLTHCGIEWAYLDGRYWVPERPTDPPSHWAAIEPGAIVLADPDLAVFEAEEGGGARFVPAPASFRPEPCA